MSSKLFLAAGSLGVASLAFVGVGGYAAFTDAVNGHIQASSGVFAVNVSADTTNVPVSCTSGGMAQNLALFGSSGCFEWAAVNGSTNAPTEQVSAPGSWNNYTGLTISISNASPGVAYAANFGVQDYGSLQGIITQVEYQAPAYNALAQGSTVYFYQATSQYSSSNPIPDGCTRIVGANCLIGGGTNSTSGTIWTLLGSTPAYANASFKVTNAFLQPWRQNPTSGLQAPGDEGGASFKAIFAVADATGNTAENETITPSFNVIGETLP
ncbi:MAG: hypothetical protein M0Z91_10765 [Actinomycetota bacterium]|nr:hypothetical protein [Actinomycetota bacterium]